MNRHAEDFESDASAGEAGGADAQYYESYTDVAVHRLMLSDGPRMRFYQQALQADPSVCSGKVVVDVGSGSGILSCWAAQAGAAHVLSIEASQLADVQRVVLERNGLSQRVTLVAETVERLAAAGVDTFLERFPCVREHGGVDVVVSEWMGFYLLHEGMLASVLRARDFFAAVNAALGSTKSLTMIPSEATIHVAPVSTAALRERKSDFWRSVGGVDMSVLGQLEWEESVENVSPLIEVMPPDSLLHSGTVLWQAQMQSLTETELDTVSATCSFDALADASSGCAAARQQMEECGGVCVEGFCLWFTVGFNGTVLDTSPLAEPTHWKQTTILLPRQFREERLVTLSEPDEELGLRVTMTAERSNKRYYTLDVELV